MASLLDFYGQIDLKMLTYAPNDGPKRHFLLPICPIIETVEQNDCVVPSVNVWVAQKLNQYLFKPEKTIFVVRKLRHK